MLRCGIGRFRAESLVLQEGWLQTCRSNKRTNQYTPNTPRLRTSALDRLDRAEREGLPPAFSLSRKKFVPPSSAARPESHSNVRATASATTTGFPNRETRLSWSIARRFQVLPSSNWRSSCPVCRTSQGASHCRLQYSIHECQVP